MARWDPIVVAEMTPYIGTCLFRCNDEFFAHYPKYKVVKAMMFLQEKRDKTTGEWLKDKAGLLF